MGGKKRINYIDSAKGMGIFLVVWGHLLPECFMHQWIYSFHMPLFFVLTGILLVNREYAPGLAYVKKRFGELMIPYFFFSAVYLVAYELPVNGESLTGLAYMGYQTLCFRGMAPLWFLASLFWGEIVLALLHKLKKWKQHAIFCLLMILSLTVLVPPPGNISGIIANPWLFLVRTVFCILFLMVGEAVLLGIRWVSERVSRCTCKRTVFLVSGVILLCATGFIVWVCNLRINLHLYKISNPVAFFSVGTTASFGLILMAIALDQNRHIREIGKNSLAVMVIHYPLSRIILRAMEGTLGDSRIVMILVSFVIALVLTEISSYVGFLLMRYLPFSLGKTKQCKTNN